MFSSNRVSDSDDLKMTESEVGRLAFAIEKEMFNICLSTDSKYKNKYRTLMLHLKDPKNKVSQHEHMGAQTFLKVVQGDKASVLECLLQGLFYRVIGGQVTPFRLVRLSAEEMLSKEISEWRKSESSEVKKINLFPFYKPLDFLLV